MKTFDFYFGVQLGNLGLRHSDSLSKTIQKPTLSAGDCQSLASLSIKTMQKLGSDGSFDLFWTNVDFKADKLEIGPPELPRKRRRPARFFLEMLSQNFLQKSNLITDKSILKLLTL